MYKKKSKLNINDQVIFENLYSFILHTIFSWLNYISDITKGKLDKKIHKSLLKDPRYYYGDFSN